MGVLNNISNTVAVTVAGLAVLGCVGSLFLVLTKDREIDALKDHIAEQKITNANAFRELVERYSDATDIPIADADVDCILHELAGDSAGQTENCGPM